MLKGVKANQLLRNNYSDELWLVIEVYPTGLLVVNLNLNENPAECRILLPRDYSLWTKDLEVKV